ncbi:MAG TPA: pseudouridine synthase [Burkholderiales bacterium]|nr:pseudouridine synthase [Burkholderiales bacterium]
MPGASQKLQKVLAQAGLGSRRAMEELVRAGRVTVNGEPARIGARVGPGDVIRVEGRLLRGARTGRAPRVLLYHKPEGEIVSRDDPAGRASVFDRLPPLRGARWLAVGRLDYNTCGLLILTDDGGLANRMMHPRYGLEREYAVRVRGKLTGEQVARLRSGIELGDGKAQCDSVEEGGGEGTNHWYRIVIREGRNRVVRRLFEALGLAVSRLMRVRFGPVALPPRLKRGQHVELPPHDVRQLLTALESPLSAREAARPQSETRSRPRVSPAR